MKHGVTVLDILNQVKLIKHFADVTYAGNTSVSRVLTVTPLLVIFPPENSWDAKKLLHTKLPLAARCKSENGRMLSSSWKFNLKLCTVYNVHVYTVPVCTCTHACS